MSKLISESSISDNQKITKKNRINILPKVERNITNKKSEEVLTKTKNKKIFISEKTSNTIRKGAKYHFSNQRIPSPILYNILTHSPSTNYQILEGNEINEENLLKNNNIKKENNIIYNRRKYNNNDFYISNYQYKYNKNQKAYTKKPGVFEYNSCSYDAKKTKKTIKYSYNSPEKNSKILVKSILCSPISVSYTEIDNPLIENTYKEYHEEIEETEIITKRKMRKIWDNESECETVCTFSCMGEKNNKNYSIIGEYEEKIKELNQTVYNLRNTQTTLKQQIEELKYNLNYQQISQNQNQLYEIKSWDNFLKKEIINSFYITGEDNTRNVLIIQKLAKFSIIKPEKSVNEIDFGTNIEILPPIKKQNKKTELKIQYLDKIYMQPIPKFKNIKQSLKGFDIIRTQKPKQINNIDYLEESQIIQNKDKLKHKTKINNIIETTNNIFIPPKKKEPFTWDTFYGQELSILSKKRKHENTIDFLEGFDILRTPKPENEIHFSDIVEILPEPKEPYEIFFGDELFIPEKVKKLKTTPKPKNKVEHRDRIKLLGKTRGKNIVQKVTLVEIYGFEKIIQYEENDYLFIPRIEKPENIIEENDYIEILPEPIRPLEFICEPCDCINIISLDKPKNEKQSLESFDIFRTPRPANIMEQINPIFIEATPRDEFFEVEFGDEIFIEKILKPENKPQRLKGFNILKKPKPLNSIQIRDKIQLLPKHIKPHKLICQKSDLFTINRILKPVNKMQRLGGFGIIKKFKKAGNKLYKSDSFYILRQPKALNYIENTANINLLGIEKNSDLEIIFGDEIYIEEKERPINRMQRIQEIKILKKSKPKNLKQKITDFQFLKKVKPKNTIQKRDDIYLYSNIKQNKELFLDVEFGDEIFIGKVLKPENKSQRLKGFSILKKPKPLNSIQIRDEIQILPKEIKPLKLKGPKGNNNKLQKLAEFMIKPIIKQMKDKNSNSNNYSNNTIVDTANFQIISVSIRELYQQRLQGFVIYKKEKEPNEIEKNYNFIIRKEYDALLARPLWNDLEMQNEQFYIPPSPNEIKLKDIRDDLMVEINSQNSRYNKDTFICDSFSNSNELNADICRICGGKKIINENNVDNINNISESKINIFTSREDYNNNYNNSYYYNYNRKTNDNNVNVIKTKLYKTLLAIPRNEVDHINNMELTGKDIEDNNIIYNSDDEITKGKMICRNNRRNYSNKTYVINKRRYNNNYNLYGYNETNENKSDIINKNGGKNKRIIYNYKSNEISRKRGNYRNKNNNSSFGQIGYSFYRKCSPDDTLNKMCQHQSKSQLKSLVINKNRKRKLFRFEEGKGIKIIYNE